MDHVLFLTIATSEAFCVLCDIVARGELSPDEQIWLLDSMIKALDVLTEDGKIKAQTVVESLQKRQRLGVMAMVIRLSDYFQGIVQTTELSFVHQSDILPIPLTGPLVAFQPL